MAINNYDTLKTAVENWLDDSNVTAQIPDFITLGEMRIYRKLRIRAMEEDLSVVISGGEATLPSDYAELKHARVVGVGGKEYSLDRETSEYIYSHYPNRTAESRPQYIARDGDKFIFGPYPDQNYTIKGKYYKKLAALSASNTSNWFTTNAPDVLLAAALVEATPFVMEDERLNVWAPKLANILDEMQKEDNKEKVSGSPKRSVAR